MGHYLYYVVHLETVSCTTLFNPDGTWSATHSGALGQEEFRAGCVCGYMDESSAAEHAVAKVREHVTKANDSAQ